MMEREAILDLVRKTKPPDATEVRTIKKLIRLYVDGHKNTEDADNAVGAIYNAYLNIKMAHIAGDGSMAQDAMKQLQTALASVEP